MPQNILAQHYPLHIWITFIIFLRGEEELPKRTEVPACVLTWPPDPSHAGLTFKHFWLEFSVSPSSAFMTAQMSSILMVKVGLWMLFIISLFCILWIFFSGHELLILKKFFNFYVIRLWIVNFRPILIKSFWNYIQVTFD